MIPLFALFLVTSQDAQASSTLELPPLFGDHMVLQCDRGAALWGKAPPGAAIGIELTRPLCEDRIEATTQAGSDGSWRVVLRQGSGGPWSMRVWAHGSPPVAFEDVWFGDVWICAGQSNMEWPLAESTNAQAEIAAADRPLVRLFQVPHRTGAEPRSQAQGSWTLCTPETARAFSAVGYHFGRALSEHLDRLRLPAHVEHGHEHPVGLIQAAWGGTPAEAWTERSFLDGVADFAPILERTPPHEAWAPSALFNGMIAQLTPLSVTGAIWYQGESNADRAEQYRTLFPAMIRSWRKAFGREDLPFLFVQLANFMERKADPGESEWAELREAQAMTLALPHTGMAVAIDIGAADDIHPRDKRTVGERLALEARRVAHGEDVASRGPTYRSMRIEGGTVHVELEHAQGLKTTDGGLPLGFALAGEDRVFHWADASLGEGRVVLRCPEVSRPLAVRFAWADNPAHNLVNALGLPAVPFRSDDWPGLTAGRR